MLKIARDKDDDVVFRRRGDSRRLVGTQEEEGREKGDGERGKRSAVNYPPAYSGRENPR